MILHDWEKIPDHVDSDIDYVVRGSRPRNLVHDLISFCEDRGWSVVQILEHEADALYCVCIQNDAPFGVIPLDVCWDYRRKGIDLIGHQVLFEGAWTPSGRNFKVPSSHVEFLYRLVKAAAKKKDLATLPELEGKMKELFESNKSACLDLLERVAGYRGEGDWAEVMGVFENYRYFGRIREGRQVRARELSLFSRRILEPTGLWVSCDQENAAISEVIGVISNAFRRVRRVEGRVPKWRTWGPLVKSTLLVQTGAKVGGGSTLHLAGEGPDPVLDGVTKVREHLAARVKRRWNYPG